MCSAALNLSICAGGRHNMLPPHASWPLTLKVMSESRVTWATSVPILVFLGLSVLDLGPMYATDRINVATETYVRQTSDAHHPTQIPFILFVAVFAKPNTVDGFTGLTSAMRRRCRLRHVRGVVNLSDWHLWADLQRGRRWSYVTKTLPVDRCWSEVTWQLNVGGATLATVVSDLFLKVCCRIWHCSRVVTQLVTPNSIFIRDRKSHHGRYYK